MGDETTKQVTIYEVIGGQPVIDQLVERFYHFMDTLPEVRELRDMHQPDLTETKRVLKLYLAQWMGGPGDYSAERGHPRLRARHLPVQIGVAERDAWMLCMDKALAETVADARVRDAIHGALAPLADWMRNKDE